MAYGTINVPGVSELQLEAAEVKVTSLTLSSSKWIGTSAPYQYDLSRDLGFKFCTVGFDSKNGTEDQLTAAQSANIHGGTGTIMYAYGDKPTVDIPVTIEYGTTGSSNGVIAVFSGGGGGGFTLVEVPTVTGSSFSYTGYAQGPTITGLDSKHVTVTGATATDIGSYTLTLSLTDKTTSMWQDLTTDDKTYSYDIGSVVVQAPTVTIVTYTYTGKAQGPVITNLDSDRVTVTNATATDAGTYTLTLALKDTAHMTWSDTSTSVNKTYSYTIDKADGTLILSANSVTLNPGTLTASVTASGYVGTLSVASGDEAVATVTQSNGTITITATKKSGSTNITVTSAATTNYAKVSKTIVVAAKFTSIYGATWDGTSTTAWTRTDEAADFTDPVPYVKGATSYGSPFDNLQPWAGMVKSERTGGTMVAIPKFWYKLTQNGTAMSIQIADGQEDGFSVSPAHMDRGDGKGERDVVYIGRYHCNSSYKSVTGNSPVVSITRSTARTNIHNVGSTIWQMDFAMRFTIWLLYIVEFADWNSQQKIGYGCGNNSGSQSVGASDSMPYHTGTMQTSRNTYGVGVQYRNVEGLWDNVLDWMDGCYYNGSGMNVILNPSKFSDTANGTSIGTPASGWSSTFTVKNVSGTFATFIPSATSGSNSTYSCDSWYFNSSYPCLYVGGNYSQNLNYGLFFILYNSTSYTYSDIGCRLQELP